MAIDFKKVMILKNGVQVINCTPHSISFLHADGTEEVVEESGATLMAQPIEEVVRQIGGVTYVKTVFSPSDEGDMELDEISQYVKGNLVIVGSIISAQAWPGIVVSPVPSEGYERVAPAEKRFQPDKFAVF